MRFGHASHILGQRGVKKHQVGGYFWDAGFQGLHTEVNVFPVAYEIGQSAYSGAKLA